MGNEEASPAGLILLIARKNRIFVNIDESLCLRLRTRTRAGCSRRGGLGDRLAILKLDGVSLPLKPRPLFWSVDDGRARRTARGAAVVAPVQPVTVVAAPGWQAAPTVAAADLDGAWTCSLAASGGHHSCGKGRIDSTCWIGW